MASSTWAVGGADVARRLVAADVLLAGLDREPVRRLAVHVLRHADESPRKLAGVLVAGGEIGGVRTAVAHGNPEALARADRDVGTEFAGWCDLRQSEKVGSHHDQGARRACGCNGVARIDDAPVGGRVLEQYAAQFRGVPVDGVG